MGKKGPVFVINPPLLQESQASSGSATITANPSRPSVPLTASSGAREGQVATARRLREGRRARRRAGGAGGGEGGREGGGKEGKAIRGGGESSLPQLARRMGVRDNRPPRGVTAAAKLARRGAGARRF